MTTELRLDYLGPSLNSIAHTFVTQVNWLSERTWTYTDYDGTTKTVPMTEEEWQVAKRVDQLEDLMHLRDHVTWNHDTQVAMHFGMCPCPGVPRYIWDPEDDPMGDMMGWNE